MKKHLTSFLILVSVVAFAQEDAWVYFNSKPNAASFLANPINMLSQKAIDRRTNQQIVIDFTDVPVHINFITQVKSAAGITVLAKSKWFNALHIRGTQANINALLNLSFVSTIEFANTALNNPGKPYINKKEVIVNKNLDVQITFLYGNSSNQIQMLNGHLLHQNNFTGTGLTIAVMDNGFPGVNTTLPFKRLRDNNLIIGGYDFVNRDTNFYDGGTHGTMVLSTIGGYIENGLVGTAPDAKYYLFKTEATAYENPLEESLWVEAAEHADSLGVDIITTSLGYSTFDNPNYNYTYASLNGVTTYSSKGADVAFSKGIFIVTSAGNSGGSSWLYITTPADAINTLTVGAVDATNNYASFSSIGPTPDNRVKPDVVAQGVSAVIATSSGSLATANGTSFSCPITAGLVACLWQSLPGKTNIQLLQLIKQSAHIYNNPTAQLGYGIPNFYAAYQNGLNLDLSEFNTPKVSLYPNPFSTTLNITLPANVLQGELKVYNLLGQLVFNTFLNNNINSIRDLELQKGTYIYKIKANNIFYSGKIIKEQ